MASVRLDVSTFLEAERQPPPVLFETREHLIAWTWRHFQRAPERIEPARPTSAVRVRGDYTGRGPYRLPYDQIWVRATYTGYARAMREVALRGYNVDRAALEGTNADHVINRARLRGVPDSWVVLFPVHTDANCPFGAIEGQLPPVHGGFGVLRLPALVALKLFCGKLPRTRPELSHAMRDVRGRFLQRDAWVVTYCDEMEAEALRYLDR